MRYIRPYRGPEPDERARGSRMFLWHTRPMYDMEPLFNHRKLQWSEPKGTQLALVATAAALIYLINSQ